MADSPLIEQKAARRRQLRGILASLSAEAAASASAKIRTRTLATLIDEHGGGPCHVAAFAALPGEPDLMPLVLDPSSPIGWHLPRVEGDSLKLFRVRSENDLVTGAYGIREPDPAACSAADVASIDFFLVPGLGFDPETGHRLGRGKGFYDRFLIQAKPESSIIGVGFDCQCGPVPHEKHDVPLHAILTESALLSL